MSDAKDKTVHITMTETQARLLTQSLGQIRVTDLPDGVFATYIVKFQRAMYSKPSRSETTDVYYHLADKF